MIGGRAIAFLFSALIAATGVSAQQGQGIVTVTIGLAEAIDMPEGAILEVTLLDVSRADAPSKTIAMERLPSPRYPVRVELPYDASEIDPTMSYVISASVAGKDNALLLRTTRAYPVLTQGAGNEAEIVLETMPAAKTAVEPETPYLAGSAWRCFEIGGRMFVGEDPPTLVFGESGTFALYTGCNRFRGQAEVWPQTIAFPEAMAGTRMACPPPRGKLESDVLGALKVANGYTRGDDLLVFTNDAGVPVIRFQHRE